MQSMGINGWFQNLITANSENRLNWVHVEK